MHKNFHLIFFILVLSIEAFTLTNSEKWTSFCNANSPETFNNTAEGIGQINLRPQFASKSWLVHLNEDSRSGIDLIVSDFLLENHFLVIRDVIASRNSAIQFVSGNSSKPLFFKIPLGRSFYMEFCPENMEFAKEDNVGYFTVAYKRSRIKFEDDPLLDPNPDEQKKQESSEIYLSGRAPAYFSIPSFLNRFKKAVRNMAEQYCEYKNLSFASGKPEADMISIYAVHMCPNEWLNRETCASVLHSICVLNADDINSKSLQGYELTAEHVKEMWEMFGGASEDLKQLGLSIYQFHNKYNIMVWWFLTIVLPVIFLLAFVFFVWKAYKYVKIDKQNNQLSDSQSLPIEVQKKIKLKPSKYQIIPRFMKEGNETNNDSRADDYAKFVGIKNGEKGSYCAGLFLGTYKLHLEEGNLAENIAKQKVK